MNAKKPKQPAESEFSLLLCRQEIKDIRAALYVTIRDCHDFLEASKGLPNKADAARERRAIARMEELLKILPNVSKERSRAKK